MPTSSGQKPPLYTRQRPDAYGSLRQHITYACPKGTDEMVGAPRILIAAARLGIRRNMMRQVEVEVVEVGTEGPHRNELGPLCCFVLAQPTQPPKEPGLNCVKDFLIDVTF